MIFNQMVKGSSDSRVGDIRYATAAPSSDWLLTNGSAIDSSLYPELFKIGFSRVTKEYYTYLNNMSAADIDFRSNQVEGDYLLMTAGDDGGCQMTIIKKTHNASSPLTTVKSGKTYMTGNYLGLANGFTVYNNYGIFTSYSQIYAVNLADGVSSGYTVISCSFDKQYTRVFRLGTNLYGILYSDSSIYKLTFTVSTSSASITGTKVGTLDSSCNQAYVRVSDNQVFTYGGDYGKKLQLITDTNGTISIGTAQTVTSGSEYLCRLNSIRYWNGQYWLARCYFSGTSGSGTNYFNSLGSNLSSIPTITYANALKLTRSDSSSLRYGANVADILPSGEGMYVIAGSEMVYYKDASVTDLNGSPDIDPTLLGKLNFTLLNYDTKFGAFESTTSRGITYTTMSDMVSYLYRASIASYLPSISDSSGYKYYIKAK